MRLGDAVVRNPGGSSVIFAMWHRWVETGQAWWLLVLAGVVMVDVLVGSWLIAQELRLLKAAW